MSELPHPLTLARGHAETTALIGRPVSTSWRQFGDRAARLTEQLILAGVGDREPVAVVAEAEENFPLLLGGLLGAQAVAVMLSPRFPDVELARTARQSGCRFQLIASRKPRRLAGLRTINVDFDDLALRRPYCDNPPILSDGQPITTLFTSGSSGTRKAVTLTYGNHYYSAQGSNENLPLTPGDRWLLSLPLFHVGGLGIFFRCLLAGATMVHVDRETALAAQIVRDRVTHLSLVPTQLRRLLRDPGVKEAAGRLKAILLGGGPIPTQLVQEARSMGLPVYPTYGMTEAASQVATTSEAHPDCMKALNYRELRVSDGGEIVVGGQTIAPGVSVSGWYHTGDVGKLDDDGCLTVLGRSDAMFISGGENIHPETIELALAAIDGIVEALVVPVEDTEFGSRPVAFLKCDDNVSLSNSDSELSEESRFGLDHRSLDAALEETLPRFMIPIEYLTWPREYRPAGLKADREFLASLAAKLLSSRG